MSLFINNNQFATVAAGNLGTHYANLGTSIERLTTGLRINSAADDAAGLAVRETMRSDITVLNQGVRNAEMAINLLQTAEGAMEIIDEKLIRMKELAEQAATGTYTHQQRQIIHSEFAAMAAEIDRIAQSTEFAGRKLIDGTLSTGSTGYPTTGGWLQTGNESLGSQHFLPNGEYGDDVGVKIHFGTGNERAEDYYFINIEDMTTNGLFRGIGDASTSASNKVSVSTQHSAQIALEQIDSAIVAKEKNRAYLGSMMNRLSNTIASLDSQRENLQAAESQVSDVDLATEMTEFTKNQVLTQSAVAMLAQANSLPQMALRLLG